ncbi:MAG: hypothetical protein U9N86_14745 [Bacteroidota bacterium]|nr:hypothetical protein [Bacteroidota bacterium]
MKIKRKYLLYCLAFMVFSSSGLTKISAFSGGSIDSDEKDAKIMVGYVPTTYKKASGTRVEHIYFAGNHFTRTVCDYETFRCCKSTGNEMDGCSAPVKCPDSL